MALEGKADRENSVVIIGVEVRGGDLESAADAQPESLPEVEPSKHDTWCHEHLRLAVVGTVVEMGVVHFEFRPESSSDVILQRVVPWVGIANLGLVARGETDAECALSAEAPETLAVGNRRRNDRIGCAILMLPGRHSGLEEGSQDVISVFLVGRQDAVLDEEPPVAKAILHSRVVVDQVRGWGNQDDFDVSRGNDFEALRSTVVF